MRKSVWLMAAIVGASFIITGLAHRVAAEEAASHWKRGGNMQEGHVRGMHHDVMAFCPFTADAQIKVTPTTSGVTIEITATDPTTVTRIQKKAQILQLMHEFRALGPERRPASPESDPETPPESS